MGPRPRNERAYGRSLVYAAALSLVCGHVLSACDLLERTTRETVYQPQHTHPDEAVASRIEGLERWWLEVEGGQVEAWYLPPIAPAEERAPAVIFAHGNRELIEGWAQELAPYREMGFAVLLPEYRSYGRSGGMPGEAAVLGDFSHFYDRLVDRREIDPARIVFHGRSLGGGAMGVLSARRRAAALILESTFTSLSDLGSQWLAPDFVFTADRFDTRAVLLTSSTPTLILHGTEDALVPFKHAEELARVAWDARLIRYRAGHNDLPRTERAYWRRIRAFLRETNVLRETAVREVNPR